MAPLANIIGLSLLAINGVAAHPGHNVAQEAAEKAQYMKMKPRTVRECASQLDRRGLSTNNVVRRQKLAADLRAKRGLLGKRMLGRRAFSDYNFSHASSDSSITLDTDESSLFTDNSSCTLQTDVTQGPYYVNGELIRQDVTDGEDGIPLYVDIQVIDSSTCEPVTDVYMDFWHANSTGVYSGVVANGNGNSGDTSNLNSKAMRGIQQTDSNGLVQFHTNFPGHYDGRATHIHIMTHTASDTAAADNGTLLGDGSTTHASHVGQLFFDQDLITQVSAVSPYSEITASITENSQDSILAQEADTTDPFVEYVLLGSDISDGILAWISVGIDPTKDSEVSSAATYYESGGVANSNSMGGGAGGSSGGPGGNNTSGGGPSGSSTSGGSTPGNGTSGSFTMSGSGTIPSGTVGGSASSGVVGGSSVSNTVASSTSTSTSSSSAGGSDSNSGSTTSGDDSASTTTSDTSSTTTYTGGAGAAHPSTGMSCGCPPPERPQGSRIARPFQG